MIRCSRFAISRAGMMNSGTIVSASNVICHESKSIAMSTSVTLMMLLTTFDSVPVKACCAPSTSLLMRLISAPVCVRVKNAIGIRWMCVNTAERMS